MRLVIWALGLMSCVVNANDELQALAEAVYFEARSEPIACQIITAQTIMNRVYQARFPDTVEGVVHQKGWSSKGQRYVCQYSYFCDGKSDSMTNIQSEVLAYQVASMVLLSEVPNLSEGADHYYAHNIVTPDWEPSLTDRYICNNHTYGKLEW